ncbi:MAG: aromatic amino acid lyase [Acidobacteria bacterium]|nr:aromatic amino acid lyase [Acidobacteriota bacterium]
MPTAALSTAVQISNQPLTIENVVAVARRGQSLGLSDDDNFRRRIERGHQAVRRALDRGEVIYGVNTGFGGNVKFLIPDSELQHHQENLLDVLSCGVGDPYPAEVVRAAILLRANALARGYSGVRLVVIERLIDLLNHGITPVVPRYGSVGASGDLCPSAYISRVLLGRGTVFYRGEKTAAAEALRAEGIEPIRLQAKEGLALLNGTTMMTGMAVLVAFDAEYLLRIGLGALALAVEALKSSPDYYHPLIHMVKNHPGQLRVAEMLESLLMDSRLAVPLDEIRRRVAGQNSHNGGVVVAEESIQSPYSLRCAPQGLGPMLEALEQVRLTVEREVNSVNDNPLVDPGDRDGDPERVFHTGNFYGGHIARAMDGLKLDMANLANWMHSIMALLMDDRFSAGLPSCLSPHPGVFQGFKGMQVVHSSLVTALRQMSGSSLIHTLPTEQFNQDVVSLGTHASLTALEMLRLLRDSMSIVLLSAAQAVDLRAALLQRSAAEMLGVGTRSLYRAIRERSAFLEADRPLDSDIERLSQALEAHQLPVLR